LKSDRNKSINKRYNATSDYNKKYIRRAMLLSSAIGKGITAEEIVNRLASRKPPINLTDRSVYRLLEQLITEDKVYRSKSKKKYFLKDFIIDDGWSIFAEFLNEIQNQNLLSKISSLKIYSNERAFSNELENTISDFGNIVGAFVTYILVESLRPNERLFPIQKRIQTLNDFLDNSLSLRNILPSLLRIIPGNPDRMIMGTDNESFESLVNAYDHVYPDFRELLDNSFKRYSNFNWSKSLSCDHEWHRVNIHKIGERFECRKCLGLVVCRRCLDLNVLV
jgi:hypothetical protein